MIILQASGGYLVMFILFSMIAAFATARLFSSIWLQIWLDKGDGLEDERRANVSLYNITLSEDQIKGFVSDNPGIQKIEKDTIEIIHSPGL